MPARSGPPLRGGTRALTRVRPLVPETAAEVRGDLLELADQVTADLRTYGFADTTIERLYRVDLRFAGQEPR